MNRVESKLKNFKIEDRKALVAFIIAGYPSLNGTKELALNLEKEGVDILEIGVPFSDPLADGPVISQAYYNTLKSGFKTKDLFSLVEDIRKDSNIPLVVMVYYNIVYCYGVEKFINNLKKVGVDGIIVPDIPLEEREELNTYCNNFDVILIPLVAPTSKDRIKKIVKDSRGFTYCVSVKGTTGKSIVLTDDLIDYMKFCRNASHNQCFLGFGVDSKESVNKVKEHCDGVIIGSAIVKRLNSDEEFDKNLRKIRSFIREVRKEMDKD
ncbi:tryptophan synthase, alpha chain [Clostridium cavendishii DSM 21758]|uniref:Tryptophan synthase alpha chain n=1 Tax=Clostridium cavendishii DSM 21758 TaxID=1121302 RepID=A0A1M6I690_9CLOT|nr:tryptophan synthase subunit alpha [Clostridium cavendishii]SHJ29947.1 tryptophan synthase, alpha chain [Clostridium cavendishii DSM 21758]